MDKSTDCERSERATKGVTDTSIPRVAEGATAQPNKPEQAQETADNTGPNTDILQRILGKLEALTDSVKEIRQDGNNLKQDIVEVKEGIAGVQAATKNMEAGLETKLTEMNRVLSKTKEELVYSRRKQAMSEQMLAASNSAYKSLSLRITQMENKSRQCNVMVDGLPETEGEDLRQKIIDLAERICPSKVTRDSFMAIHRLGKQTYSAGRPNAKRARVVMVIFKDITTRNSFYFARMQLKSIDQLKGIYLSDDVTIETRRAREEYRSVANIARSAGVNVRVHDDGLVLDGTKYKLFEADSLPAEYSLAKAKTVKTAQGIFFHSENSFLSNFYASPIWVDDIAFPTAEHRYQSQKCKMAGDLRAMKRVITAATPLDAKKIADMVPENAEWRSKREGIMKSTIDEKFSQNEDIAKLLVNTGDAKLYEATMNSYFGIGATLHSREVRDLSFKGLNKLGEILQAKRSEIAATVNSHDDQNHST